MRGPAQTGEAKAALESIGAKAVPYLLDWIARPNQPYSIRHYPAWALHGFEVLGPTAKSAVPKLISLLGETSNNAEIALVDIGPDAAPALANKLVETLTDTNPPSMFRRRPGPAEVQQIVLRILSEMERRLEPPCPPSSGRSRANIRGRKLEPPRPWVTWAPTSRTLCFRF